MVLARVEDREAVEVEMAMGQAHKVEVAIGIEGSLTLYKASYMVYLTKLLLQSF